LLHHEGIKYYKIEMLLVYSFIIVTFTCSDKRLPLIKSTCAGNFVASLKRESTAIDQAPDFRF